MARMYPNRLDPDTESQAERELYAIFHDELADDYVVFHSVAWQGLGRDGRRRDGEADFVIAHPDRGVLILEVKGGIIAHNPRTGRWTSEARNGQVHPIHDPFNQAKTSKYELRDQIDVMLPSRNSYAIGHAVAFPDITTRSTGYGPDKPADIILDQIGVASISKWVGACMAYWRGQQRRQQSAPGDAVMDALMDLLGKEWELRPALWGDLLRETNELIQLTEQQYGILNVLNRQPRAAISGCAGSGKTMLAVEKAQRLAKQGFNVLLTCYNRSLAEDLAARLGNRSNLTVQHFHGLCADFTRQAGISLKGDNSNYFYTVEMPEALLEAADRVDTRFDAVVVDEGQDFEGAWWLPLQVLLAEPDDGILYIFYDDNQRIYHRKGDFPIQQPPYPLTINCRNTQAIHRLVSNFYSGDTGISAHGPEGRPVELFHYRPAAGPHLALSGLLRRLLHEDRVPADQITILSPYSFPHSRLRNLNRSGSVRISDQSSTQSNEIFFSTVYSFKGLERAVVVLAELERWQGTQEELASLLYVGCSRARNLLVVLLPEDVDPQITQLFSV